LRPWLSSVSRTCVNGQLPISDSPLSGLMWSAAMTNNLVVPAPTSVQVGSPPAQSPRPAAPGCAPILLPTHVKFAAANSASSANG